MAASPANFLFRFLMVSIALWMVFIFVSSFLAWILSRIVGASVGLRFGGWKCLRDIVVKFKKGAVESISVGEIKLSLRQSLVKLGVGIISKDPKLQFLISDMEIVLRPSSKSSKKSKSRKPRTSGRGKWMVVANIARYLSVSVTEIVVKTPKATFEVKEVQLDISKDGGSKPNLFVKLHMLPILVYMSKPRISCDQSSNLNNIGDVGATQPACVMLESAPFSCEELSISCEFGHVREAGVVIQHVDINCGEVVTILNEELLSNNNKSCDSLSQMDTNTPTVNSASVEKPQKQQEAVATISRYTSIFPEKIYFSLPRLEVRFMHKDYSLSVENNITGIQLKSTKSRSTEDVGESTRIDFQMDFSEIHLLREAGSSILEIVKVDVVSFLYIPEQPTSPVRAEVDIKLGGTQCNVMMNRLRTWLSLQASKEKKKKEPLFREETSAIEKQKSAEQKMIMWTCTVSAPEMTLVLYSMSGLPLYHACSQSSHVFANNISVIGTAVHMELGEINLYLADEYQESLKESLFSLESNSGSLLHVAKISLDWGRKDMETSEDVRSRCKLALFVDVTGMGIFLTYKRVEYLVFTSTLVRELLKNLSTSGKKAQTHSARVPRPSGKGTQLLKFNLERCFINFCGETCLDNTVIADPKRVNYGSQGGRVLLSVLADGKPRNASIMPTVSDEHQNLRYSVSLDVFHLSLCLNKEKQSTQMELERARSVYQEYLKTDNCDTKVVLFDMQNAKFVRRSGGHKEIAVCSLFSATDITARWEPDLHLALFELALRLKLLVHNQKFQAIGNDPKDDLFHARDVVQKKEDITVEYGHLDKHKKKDTIFAVDVEMLNISAEVGDGVEMTVQVQSIFSENARIGLLLEGLMVSLNGARVLRSSRIQISRVPSASVSSSDRKTPKIGTWDWVVQALDVHICMPFRLELRAIDDSVEEMLRALKLITAAKTNLLGPMKKESSTPQKPSLTKFGHIKFCIRKLTADIEEEPIQGWLEEHYQLIKGEARELSVRLKFLDDLISVNLPEMAETNDFTCKTKIQFEGVDVDLQDTSATQNMRDEVYKKSFRSYYEACKKLVPSEGSGACREGFQAGFKPSKDRTSLLSVVGTELEITLTRIDGGEGAMVDILKKLDPVCQENNIPFSRLYGSNILLNTATLAVHLRNYTFPLFSATYGKCEGRVLLAQQATCFQPQVYQDVFIGRWRKVRMLRSASGTTPPMKTYLDIPIHFHKAEMSFGVGYEPAFADVSYAFSVALRRANLSLKRPNVPQPPKRERSLPWWDDMRNYIHGNVTLFFGESEWNLLATTDPYEKLDKLQIISGAMEIQQSDGCVNVSAVQFKMLISSVESLVSKRSLKVPTGVSLPLVEAPMFNLKVTMDWECESGSPMNHYLFALPVEKKPREKILDPFRSTSLSLRWNFSLRPSLAASERQSPSDSVLECSDLDRGIYAPDCKTEKVSVALPTFNIGAHDIAWILRFWSLNYSPPHKLRSFSRWPRFGVPRASRSGNLSLDKVMTEFMLRLDATPACVKNMPLHEDDPAKGLTFNMKKLKYELCYYRGKQKYTFECQREPLDLVYQGFDLHMPKVFLNKDDCTTIAKVVQMTRNTSPSLSLDRIPPDNKRHTAFCTEKHRDEGFLLSCDYFAIRRQAPKADATRLLAWQEAGRKNLEKTYVRSEFENGSESDEHARSDPSDDDGYNVVIADNCQRVFVYGLKLLWTIENRDAVWSWVGGISKAFEPRKPSPSRQYAQRKLHEENQRHSLSEIHHGDTNKSPVNQAQSRDENLSDSEEEGTRHFMVNVIEPQFNLHSEDANGRFLLAAVSGRVLARSFHSVLHVGYEMIEQALGTGSVHMPESGPEMTWKRMECSVMLEHVQAHVAPTDVDPGAGLQWLPKIRRNSLKVKRTGALLERVFMPCDMYFRYTRHKGGTPDLKVKPLKELTFNSHNITATMTSRQFQVMLDVLTNLLFARLPKPRRSCLSYPGEDDEDIGEEADEVVPDGVEEVELAKIVLEQREREQKLLIDDIKLLSLCENSEDLVEKGGIWMITGGRSILGQGLKKELLKAQNLRKSASASLRVTLQKAAHLRLMEKEKNKSPSYAMRISLQINKVVWSMLVDGKSFAEAEINDMIYDFDRDYKDVGVSQFTTKYFVVRNCLPNAKSDMLLSAWNPPPEWGKKVMLRVDAKQGAPKDGHSPLELFQVEIYPLKIHLTETMYRMMWEYLFPEEEQDSQRRQQAWKFSTTGAKRLRKGLSTQDAQASSSHMIKEPEVSLKANPATASPSTVQTGHTDSTQACKSQNHMATTVSGSTPGLRRTSSFDRTWEETVAESIANELVQQAHSSGVSSSKGKTVVSAEQQDESSKNKFKDPKALKSGRSSHEEKKVSKSQEEKKSRPRKLMEFHNIKISQVELLVTYEGSRFVVNDLKLLMDTFHRVEFTGTWRRLFSRVKKHIIWGVLKSVTGMQGKKFKDKSHSQWEQSGTAVPDSDLHFSDNDQVGKSDQYPLTWLKRPGDGAGDGFVRSVRGLFNSQRRRAKAFVLRTMRGETENDFHGDWSESEAEFSPFARQLTITKAKKLIRRHTKRFRSRGQKGSSSQQRESLPTSPIQTTPFESDSSGSSPYEDFHEYKDL